MNFPPFLADSKKALNKIFVFSSRWNVGGGGLMVTLQEFVGSELKGKQINETNLLKFSFVLEIISKFQTVRTRHSPIHPIEKNIVKHIARSNYKNYLLCAWEECPEKWFMFFLSHSTVGTFGCCRVTRYPQRARNITRRERFEWGRQRSINVSGNWCAGAKVSVHNYTMLQPLGSARKLMILFHSVAFSGSGKMGKTL